jgi:hypothetical protein
VASTTVGQKQTKEDSLEDEIPDDENGDVLRRMKADGDALHLPRMIDFSVVFPGEQQALQFADLMKADATTVKVERSGCVEDLPWDVTVSIHMVPKHADITAVEGQLASHAAPLGGRNDGWGCVHLTRDCIDIGEPR